MDKLRIFFLTFFIVLMSFWASVTIPVLMDLMKGASRVNRLAIHSGECSRNCTPSWLFAVPRLELAL